MSRLQEGDGEGDGETPTLSQLARQVFERDPSTAVLEYQGRWYTCGQMRELAQQLSLAIAESGASAHATVALAARNRPSAVAALLGLLALGRSVEMIYPFQSGAGVARDLASLKSAILLAAGPDLSHEVRAAARREGVALIALGDMDVRAEPGWQRARPERAPEVAHEPRIGVLTSGTTGPPKRFPISHGLVASYVTRGNLLYALHGAQTATMPPVLLSFPLGNITGIYSTVPTLIAGLRVVLLDRFTLDGWRDHVRRYRPAHTGMLPSGVQMLLDADVPADELDCIKSLGTGAAPLDPAVQRAFEGRYGIPILLSYGATEFGGRVTAMTAELHASWGQQKVGSVGRAVQGAQLRVVDPQTRAVLGPGEEGLLEVVSPHMGPEWIRTTDVGVIDHDGFVFLSGRADGAITRGGFKILPETIERALLLHPVVSAAAVVGVADRRLGQTPVAAIELRPGVSAPATAELEAHLRQHLLATHIPTRLRFVDALPRTPSMKVDRRGVRALFDESAR
ncbi:MAG: fatty acid--CoA ligase family protein [Myxococcales bacterium]|nr:fatty acid--CoA ligase family protein [Myxococcales bacterium]